MQKEESTIDKLFKKGLVVAVVAMVIFILVAFVLFIFKGPDIRNNLVTTITSERSAIAFNEEAVKAGLSGKSLELATTTSSVLESMANQQLSLSEEYGRKIDPSEVEIDLEDEVLEQITQAKNSNRLNEYYDENIERALNVIEQNIQQILDIEDNQTLNSHLQQIVLLKEAI